MTGWKLLSLPSIFSQNQLSSKRKNLLFDLKSKKSRKCRLTKFNRHKKGKKSKTKIPILSRQLNEDHNFIKHKWKSSQILKAL